MSRRKQAAGRGKAVKTIRVNLGGRRYTDAAGHIWEADRSYHAGGWGCTNTPETDVLETTDPIAGTADQELMQSIRVGEQVHYRFDVPNGAYRVRILLAEIYWETATAERQDIVIQGRKVLADYSMFDEVGHDAQGELAPGLLQRRLGGDVLGEVHGPVGVSIGGHDLAGLAVDDVDLRPGGAREKVARP